MTVKLDLPPTTGAPCTNCGFEWWTAPGSEPKELCVSCREVEKMATSHLIIKRMGYRQIYFIQTQEEADFYGVEEPGVYATKGTLPYRADQSISNRGPQILPISTLSEALAKHEASGSEGKIVYPSWHTALRELRILEKAGWDGWSEDEDDPS